MCTNTYNSGFYTDFLPSEQMCIPFYGTITIKSIMTNSLGVEVERPLYDSLGG